MKRLLAGTFLLLALAIAWLDWRGVNEEHGATGAPPARPLASDRATPAPLATPAASANPVDANAPVPERKELEEASVGPAAGTATLRGRCVDGETGTPLGGCVVGVRGQAAGTERMDAFLKHHDEVGWKDPPDQTTGSDGRFSFTFVPPPPFRFTLGIRSPASVPIEGRWPSLAPGTVKDFGDIPLERGSEVGGQVADSKGVPQAEVVITIHPYGPAAAEAVAGTIPELRSRRHHQTRSRADGSFAFDDPVAFGTWNVALRNRQKIAPEKLEIPDGQRFTTLAIETRPAEEIETISGIVVDESGAPVEGVHIGGNKILIGPRRSAISEHDGRFRIERAQDDPDDALWLRLQREGFEELAPTESYPWGTADLRLVMQRGLAVEIVITDGATHEPIEDYTVRCFPAPGSRRGRRPGDFARRGRGHHPGGRLLLEGITRGPRVLLVEPGSEGWARSDFIRFEMTDRGAPVQRVQLFHPVTRLLRVQSTSGAPVAGTKVELLREFGSEPTRLTTPADGFDDLSRSTSRDRAAIVLEGQTDSRGELELHGSPAGTFVLRILGPGHEPVLEPQVTLAANALPLLVTVSAGATVVGKIGPPELLERLLPEKAARAIAAAGDDAGKRERIYARYGPGLLLARTEGSWRSTHPATGFPNRLRLGGDGTFEVKCVPAGTWDLHIAYWDEGRSVQDFVQTLTDLREGEVRRIEADLGHLIPVRVTGMVLRNGVPLESGSVRLVGRVPGGQDGHDGGTPLYSASVRLGAGGTFLLEARPATYRPFVRVPDSRSGSSTNLPAAEHIVVRPGKDVHAIFHLRSGALRIRLRDGAGKPVVGVAVNVTDPGATWFTYTAPTDEQGCTGLDAALVGTTVFTVIPKHLTDPDAQRRFSAANTENPNAWLEAMVSLGRAEIAVGEKPTEVELVLPASAGY